MKIHYRSGTVATYDYHERLQLLRADNVRVWVEAGEIEPKQIVSGRGLVVRVERDNGDWLELSQPDRSELPVRRVEGE